VIRTTHSVLAVGDLAFDVWQAGDREGPAVLMLHGFPQDHSCWDGWKESLVERGFRVILPDQRGYSPGARPPKASAYRLGELVKDALALLDALGVAQVHVIGHDWGGAVAWGLASRHPDRLHTLTVLSTPHPRALLHSLTRSRQLAMSWYMGVLQWPALAYRLLSPSGPGWPHLMRGLPEAARQRYATRASDPRAFAAMICWYRAMVLDAIRPSIRWGPIVVPTMYAWGMRDPALGVVAAEATRAEVVGQYEFIALPRQGHWLAERAGAELMSRVLDHLQGVGPH